MKIFVTGSAGFLGSWLVARLLEHGHEVVSCDSFIGGYPDNVPVHPAHRFTPCDILDTAALAELMAGCEAVYHTAALAYEGLSVFSPAMVTQNIFAGSVSVMSAAIQAGARRVVNCSSMARYGEAIPPFYETMRPAPVDPYGHAKASAEEALTMLGDIHGVTVLHAVPHNIYGPRQKYDDPFRNVASIMVNRMLRGLQPVIYGDGRQTRCFSYIEDVLSVLTRLMDCRAEHGEVFNVGPDEGAVSVLELAQRIAFKLDFDLDPIFMPGRPCEVKHAACSSDKIRQRFGYKTRWSLDAGLGELIAYVARRGPMPFDYGRLEIEVRNERTPKAWTERVI